MILAPLGRTRTPPRRWVDAGDAQTLTFGVFRCATRGLPPAMQLAVFLRLPQYRQLQAWSALRVGLDADHDLANSA